MDEWIELVKRHANNKIRERGHPSRDLEVGKRSSHTGSAVYEGVFISRSLGRQGKRQGRQDLEEPKSPFSGFA